MTDGASSGISASFEPILIPKHGRHFTGFDDEGMAEAPAWQVRPLEIMHLVALFDSLRVKIREDAMARDKAVCSTFWIRGL